MRSYLLSRIETQNILSINPSVETDVITAVETGRISLYDLNSQNSIQNWALNRSVTTSARNVIWDKSSETFFAILNKGLGYDSIVAWENSKDVLNLENLPVSCVTNEKIFTMCLRGEGRTSENSGGIITVASSGKITVYSSELTLVAQSTLDAEQPQGKVEASSSTALGKGRRLAYIMSLGSQGKIGVKWMLAVVDIPVELKSGEGSALNMLQIQTVDLESSSDSVSDVSCSNQGDISILWNDGTWDIFECSSGLGKMKICSKQLRRNLDLFKLDLQPFSEGIVKKRPRGVEEELRERRKLVALQSVPGTHYVVILGWKVAPSGKGTLNIALADTLYGCVHQHLSQETDPTSKTYAATSGLSSAWLGGEKGYLVVACPLGALRIDFGLEPLSLASVLGSMRLLKGNGLGWDGLASKAALAGEIVLGKNGLRGEAIGSVLDPWRSPEEATVGIVNVQKVKVVESVEVPDKSEENCSGERIVEKKSERRRRQNKNSSKGDAEEVSRLKNNPDSRIVSVPCDLWETKLVAEVEALTEKFLRSLESDCDGENCLQALESAALCYVNDFGKLQDEIKWKRNGTYDGARIMKNTPRKHKSLKFLLKKLPPPLLEAIFSKFLEMKQWFVVCEIVEVAPISVVDFPGLISAVVEDRQIAVLDRLVQFLPDLSPSDLTVALHFILDRDTAVSAGLQSLQKRRQAFARFQVDLLEKEEKARRGQMHLGSKSSEDYKPNNVGMAKKIWTWDSAKKALVAVAAVEGFSSFELCLHSVLLLPRDESILLSALSELEAREVLLLVKYLRKWMEKYLKALAWSTFPHPKWATFPIPVVSHVVTWANCLVDCHFTKLLLMEDGTAEILELHQLVGQLSKSVGRLGSLAGATGHLLKRLQLPRKARDNSTSMKNNYTVEVVDI